MSARREELTRIAARLFAEQGYQGTSLADLAEALGVQKPSLYHHIDSKEDLLWEVALRGRRRVPRGARRACPATRPRPSGSGSRCAAHLARRRRASSTSRPCSCASGATSRASGASAFLAERRRYEERIRDLFREGVERERAAHRPRRRDRRRSSSSRPPTGPTPGCAPARRHRRARRPPVRSAARRHARLRLAALSRPIRQSTPTFSVVISAVQSLA